jgi:hypothetical protein
VPAWLVRELGARRPGGPLVYQVSQILRIVVTKRGFAIDYRGARLARYATGVGKVGQLVRYQRGAYRRLSLGLDATVVRGSTTNSYLVVNRRYGSRTWTWHLDTNLRPQVREDGALLLEGSDSFLVQPPKMYSGRGKDVTPRGLRWRLAKEGSGYRLSLRLNDKTLPLPYVISG